MPKPTGDRPVLTDRLTPRPPRPGQAQDTDGQVMSARDTRLPIAAGGGDMLVTESWAHRNALQPGAFDPEDNACLNP